MRTDILATLRGQLPAHEDRLRTALTRGARVVYVGSRWRGRAVYAVFTDLARHPSAVLKVDHLARHHARLDAEWAALERIAANGALAGRVPRPLGYFRTAEARVLAQSGLPGVPMSVILRRRHRPGPRRARRDHDRVTDWLRLLHAGTPDDGAVVTIDPDVVVDQVDRALKESPGRHSSARNALERTAATAGPVTVPLRPLHGDLGPTNYFVSRGKVSAIDWEGGLDLASPLHELLVFLNQYAHAVPGPSQRPLTWEDSFRRAFVDRHWLAEVTWGTWNRHLGALGFPSKMSGYLLVATLADLATDGRTGAHAMRPGWRAMWAWRLAAYLGDE